ncbi:class I SAM-dependent methyltransferase [Imperialibacter roseus]|uniref:Class I SAM-dependent methyltransferase n=1 Tax=Imperialibacter roseus TaxID=1324217 RepID=A0ABZ0IKN1_9BACT|nr:class I SAM-dependent methyltransferase [Imperialibacter roseus]WOK05582.1 class I SAM-dependent methyltransferase [Imperialibacter roseus]
MVKESTMQKSPERYIKPLVSLKVEEFFSFLEPVDNGRQVLDAGCGEQPFRQLIEKKGMVYNSLDVAQNRSRNVDYLAAIDKPLPDEVPLNQFDVILCTEVLEHVANWEQAFENFQKLLRPGGVMIITTPFFYFLHEEPFDYWRPTPFALEHFAQRHSLRVSDVQKLGTGWDVLGTFLEVSFMERTQNAGVFGAFVFKLTRFFLSKVRGYLVQGRLQNISSLQSPFFHSVFVVLQK